MTASVDQTHKNTGKTAAVQGTAHLLDCERQALQHPERNIPAGRRSSGRRSIGARLLAQGVVIGVGALLALRMVGGWLAEPLATAAEAAPTWQVEVASTSRSSIIAFAYSRESGVHLLRIPGNGSAAARVIPARIAEGDLHVVSLGLGRLDVRGRAPVGSHLESYRATSRVVTVFDHTDGTGVRTGW